jgi:hypothetical protein
MTRKSLVTTTPITKEAGLAEEPRLTKLRRIVEGLPNAEELLALMLRKGATEPEDFKQLFVEDEAFREKVCESLWRIIKVWVGGKAPQICCEREDLEDLVGEVFAAVLAAISCYDPNRASLLSYCQPRFRKVYDALDKLILIREHELVESAMTKNTPLEDETGEWESFWDQIPARSASPEDEAIIKADLEKLAERIGFGSVDSLLAALDDPDFLPKVKRYRLRRRISKELRAMAWEIRGRCLIAPSAPNDGASAGKKSADLKGGRPK